MADVATLVDEYLADTILMQLATTGGDGPWACTVHYVPDADRNFYWLSREDRRHSQELAKDPRVAGVIVKPHEVGEKPRGIQFEGTAERVADDDVERVQGLYKDRYGRDGFPDHVFYVVKPSRIVLFDTVNFPDDPQQELKP
ncbi:MAG TPA: pyridoxamine 5'-phosphate oxidase family protein [Patescibacteria group bacterium]|jgi:uncharacterized protein YhbP (UPF0306 family)